MFGTFEEERSDEEIVYGLVDQVQSFNPLYLQVSLRKNDFNAWNSLTDLAAGVLRRQNLRQMEVDGRLEEQTLFRYQRTRMEAWNFLDRGYQRSSRSNSLLDHVTGVNRVTWGQLSEYFGLISIRVYCRLFLKCFCLPGAWTQSLHRKESAILPAHLHVHALHNRPHCLRSCLPISKCNYSLHWFK